MNASMRPPKGMPCAARLLCIALILLLATTQNPARAAIQRQPVEFSPSVTLYFINDVTLHSHHGHSTWTSSRCLDMVFRASHFKAKRINFVVTGYFLDTNGDSIPEQYCMRMEEMSECHHFTEHTVHTYFAGIKSCLTKAVDLGLDILVTPMMEDGSTGNKWRNTIALDPLKPYGDWSFASALVNPLAATLNAVIKPGIKLWFCLEGEMNLSVMKHPGQYSEMLEHVKKLIMQGHSPKDVQLLMGLCLNFNKLNGKDFLINSQQAAQLFEVPKIGALFNKLDFLGFSNYPTVTDYNNPTELEGSVQQLAGELALVGVNLQTFSDRAELMVVEYGFGGGTNPEGTQPAWEPSQIGRWSYWGIFGAYDKNKDPWKCWEWYGTEVPTKTAVRQLYNMTTKYLKAGGGPQYRVDGLFLWGVASWDLLGIHWRSYSGHGSYYETGVVRIVKEHNAEVNKGRKIPYSDQQMG